MDTPTPAVGTEQLQLLAFRVRGEECAIALTDAREIITAGTLTPVPAAPASIRGMINIRGRVVTVVDLATVLDLHGGGIGEHIIVAERGSDIFGVLVDSVTGVLRIDAKQLQHAPDLVQAKPAARFVKGVVVLEHAPIDEDVPSSMTDAKPETVQKPEQQPSQNTTQSASASADAPTQVPAQQTATTTDSRLIILLDLPGLLDEIGRTSHTAPVPSPSPVSPVRP